MVKASRHLSCIARCLHCLVSFTLAVAAHADGPPCLASVEVTPARAVVGQQVAYIARVLRRPDVSSVSWVDGLSFPSLRAEWLPGLSGHTRLRKQGTPYLAYEERRALFPLRPGRLEIPAASLSCALYTAPGDAARSVAIEVPASAVEVDELPPSGRPPSFRGLVGALEMKLAAEPLAVTLGDTVRVTLTLTGDGNLWAAAAPFGEAPFEGRDGVTAEVFARPPELTFDPGERLHVRRVFAFELVPRRAGRLVIPPYELSYFDPTSRRFAVLKTEPVEVAVALQGGAGGGAGFGKPLEAAPAEAPAWAEDKVGPVARVALGGLALAVAAGVALRLVLRRLRPAPHAMRQALQEADRARRAGDADAERRALARAVRAGLERAVLTHPTRSSSARPARPALSTTELAERVQADRTLAQAAELLQADERTRFAASGEAPELERLRAAAAALGRRP